MPANLENSAVATGLEKVFSFQSQNSKERQSKQCSKYCTIALISHASKVMFKIFQPRLQKYVNCELPDVQAGFRKGRGPRDQIANIHWIIEKAREFQKYFFFIGIQSHHFMTNRWENNGNSDRLYFRGLQNHCRQ